MSALTHAWAAVRSTSRSVKNVMWNLIGGVWAGILVVLATPWYVSKLGLEGYGILGFWLVMQVMMALLDLGMGATLVREFANSRPTPEGQQLKRDMLRTLEAVYWSTALLVTVVVALAAGWIGSRWLRVETLPRAYVGDALRLMAVALGLQFPYGLYSSGLAGLQEHGRMNALQITGNTLRYGCGAAVLFWRADLVHFFAVQAIVAGAQTLGTRWVVWRRISTVSRAAAFRPELLRRVWRFSAGMAATSLAGVLVANVDRLVLSKMSPTTELGKYAVAFTATGLLQLGIQPFYRAFFPRYAELVSSGDATRLREEYFRSCRLMAVVIVPLVVIGWVFAPQAFRAWLGDADAAIVSIFRWLLVGIAASGLTWLPAAFQQAHGWTRLHVAMIAGALVLGTPAMIWAVGVHGAVGATAVWVLHGVSDATLGLWLMHRRLLIGEAGTWYRTVLLPPFCASVALVGISWWVMPPGLGRWAGLGWAAATGIVVAATTLSFELVVGRRAVGRHGARALASGP
jgi:O-antigen/teichoic acid export membrane protein